MNKSASGLSIAGLLRLARRCGALSVLVLMALSTMTLQPTAAQAAEAAAAANTPTVDRSGFDHLTTGFELIGQHRDLPCELCHVNAIFKGTPRDCASCHGVGTQVKATIKPKSHILSTNRCESCHTPVAWNPAVNFDHAEVQGSCSSCHNNVQAQGKGPTHMDTNLECNACHSTIGWAGAVFGHPQVTTGCATCHGPNLRAKGMPDNHVPIGAAGCEGCHTPTYYLSFMFPNASGTAPPSMVHTAAGLDTTNCITCHEAGVLTAGSPATKVRPAMKSNGSAHVASGQCSGCHLDKISFKGAIDYPANHIPLPNGGSAVCTTCHTDPTNFLTYTMDHTVVSSESCATCHGAGLSFAGIAPPALVLPPGNHVSYLPAACESCHLASSTAIGGFKFTNVSGTAPAAMVHAAVSSYACATCHAAGKTDVGVPATLVMPGNHVPIGSAACESCHLASSTATGGFKLPSNVSGTAPPSMVHAAVASSACGTCHGAGKTDIGVPATVVTPNNHIPFGSATCQSCHLASSTATGGFMFTNASGTAPAAMVHSAVSGVACATCHATGLSWAGTPATILPPGNHIPIGTAACEGCHLASSTATGGFKFSNLSGTTPPAMVHTLVSSMACSTCHEQGLSWAGLPVTVLRPATLASGAAHVATGECSDCHLSTVSFKGAGVYPGNHIPLPNGSSSACAACHSDSGNFLLYTMDHTVVTSESCATCHGAGKSFAGMAPPSLKLPPANHIPFGAAACESCHLNTSTATGGFKFTNASGTTPSAMVHSAVSGVACATCHAAGKTDVGVPATVTPPGNHIPFGTAACESCHLSSSVATGGFRFTNASGTAPSAMVHSAVASMTCATCHATGKVWAGTPATVLPPSNHIPFGAAACEGCHLKTSVATGGFRFTNASGMAPPSMVHSLVSAIVCSTCHEAGQSWAGTPITVVRPANKADNTAHVVAGECSTCHFNTTSFKGASDLPANHIPLPAADANNCALCHTTAGNYSLAVMNHVNITTNCAQCHAAGLSFANMAPPVLKLPPANHVPFGTAACEQCHLASSTATGGFKFSNLSGTAPASMVHSAVPGVACATCHATGKSWVGTPATVLPPANHIPFGTAACESCHLSTSVATGGFKFANLSGTAPAAMVHSVVTSMTCATCHAAGKVWAGTPATVLPPSNHIPFGTAACEGCHLKTSVVTGGFKFTNASGTAPAAMVHSLVSASACSTCHEAGRTWIGTPATKVRPAKKADGTAHVAAGECSTCHFNTTSFKGAADLPANHIPLPAADTCAMCHTTAGNYSLYVMNHVNITRNCAQCHAYGLSFANMAPPKLVQPPAGPNGHIPSNPPNGTMAVACELCHLPTVFTTFAGTKMIHAAVRTMTCMSCHELGMKWKTNTGVRLWVRDGAGHYPGRDCGGSGCHSTRDKFAPRRVAAAATRKAGVTSAAGTASSAGASAGIGGAAAFNHQRVAGTACVSCHGPTTSIGKPGTHIATSDTCASCHTTLSWMPVTRVDHSQVKGSCVSCHNKVIASGKGSAHIASGDSCESCHTTNAWTPARFDHNAVVAHTCNTCHNGLRATGLPTHHVPTSAQCDTCHGTLGWKPAKLDHSTLTAQCVTCHNNNVALGVNATHMSTQRDCATCHAYPDWTALHFVHASATFPGSHKAAPTCVSCHTSNTDQIPWLSPGNAGSCAGCHAKDFRPELHPKTSGGLKYMAGELRNCAGACHLYSDATLGTVVKSLPGPYHRVSDATFKH